MSNDYRSLLASHGETHWWITGMRRITHSLAGPPHGRVLDVGCGPGWDLLELPPEARGVGIDRTMEHVFFRPIVLADAAQLPFASGSFDRVHALDLLDQRAVNPAAAVSEMGRVLRPGGEAVLRAPAVPWLLGAHDAMWGGSRRFRRRELEALVRAAGLRVQRLTYANTLLFPVAAASRLLARAGVGGGNDLHPLPPALNNALRAVLDGEARWLRSHNLPYGLSLLCVAVRPEK